MYTATELLKGYLQQI